MSQARSLAPDPDAEREVDLRTLWSRVVDRWWLPVVGLVAGAVVGVLVAVGGGQTWQARTLLYLGQPFTTSGGGQIQSLATNPRTVSEIIRSEFALKRAAGTSGLRVGQLRGHITSQAVTSAGQTRNQTPLVESSVNGPARVKVEEAALARAERREEQGRAAGRSLARDRHQPAQLGAHRRADRAHTRRDRRVSGGPGARAQEHRPGRLKPPPVWSRASVSRSSCPRTGRRTSSQRRCAGSLTSSTASSSSTTPRPTRRSTERGTPRTHARRSSCTSETAASAPRSSRATRGRSPSGSTSSWSWPRTTRWTRRSCIPSSSRWHGGRPTTRRRTGSSPARRGA